MVKTKWQYKQRIALSVAEMRFSASKYPDLYAIVLAMNEHTATTIFETCDGPEPVRKNGRYDKVLSLVHNIRQATSLPAMLVS